ncbi:MAG: LysR family transcriptional regulator [Solibacillus sp.]
MNYEQLHYVKVVSEYQSMTIAAEKLFVTQSAISQSLTALEKELGVKLFIRSRKGTLPTEDGHWILPKLFEIYRKMYEVKLEIASRESELKGECIISTTAGVFMTFLPETLMRFKRDHPFINFQINELDSDRVLEDVQEKRADIGFIGTIYERDYSQSLYLEPLPITSRYYLIVAKDSPFACYDEITLDEVRNEPFILYGDQYFLNILQKQYSHWGKWNVLFKSYNSEVIKKSVKAGLGVSIFSHLMLEKDYFILHDDIKAIKLIGPPFHLPVTYSIVTHEEVKNNPIFTTIKQYFV